MEEDLMEAVMTDKVEFIITIVLITIIIVTINFYQ